MSTLRLGNVFQNGPAGGSTRVHWSNTSGNPNNLVLDLNGFKFLHHGGAAGNMNGDGDVDTGELTTSIINFTGAQRTTAVPEPGGLLLLT